MIENNDSKQGCHVSDTGIVNRSAEEQVCLLSCALSSLKDAVYITDMDHNIIYVNEAIKAAQGYRPDEVLGKKAYDLFEGIPGNPSNLADLIAREARDGFWIGEIYNRRKDGTVFPVQLIMNTIYGKDGEVIGYIGISRDITEHKQSEERLREASKLEAVGIMSLAIAHEFNNILMGISGYAQLAHFDIGDRVLVKKATSTILRLTGRARTMIRRLSTFGRREKLQPKPVDLTRIIDEAIALQERELKLSNIRIQRIYKDPALVMADFSQIEQVFVNLIMNACHAMVPAGKGTLTVQVQNIDGRVEARVGDTGIGIPKDTIPRIFQPFFTSRKEGKQDWIPSLGLGLWVSRQIMEEHGGTISVESERGTTFILTLPRAIGTVREEVARYDLSLQLEDLRGKEILIIDDEEDLLIIFKKYLTRQGMKVSTAQDGREALAFCRERRYDIILMDYIMPGISGLRLVRRIREITPESRLVVITGKRIPEESEQELGSHIAGLLRKPLALKQLGKMLSRLG